MRATASLSVTSATTEAALTPRAARSSTAAFDFVSLRPTIAMLAPASASPRASPSPIPPLPPVTIATLPPRSNKRVFISLFLSSALALPDQNQSDGRKCGAISRPLDLIDHETGARPGNGTRALADPEQADGERCEAGDQKGSAHLSFSVAPHPPKLRVRNNRICRSTPMPAKQCPGWVSRKGNRRRSAAGGGLMPRCFNLVTYTACCNWWPFGARYGAYRPAPRTGFGTRVPLRRLAKWLPPPKRPEVRRW